MGQSGRNPPEIPPVACEKWYKCSHVRKVMVTTPFVGVHGHGHPFGTFPSCMVVSNTPVPLMSSPSFLAS